MFLNKLKNLLFFSPTLSLSKMPSYNTSTWNVSDIVHNEKSAKYALLILNRPITQNKECIVNLWNNASLRVTVDGGTTEWDNFLKTLPDSMNVGIKNPDLVTGDFDSITKEIMNKYKVKGCKIVHTPDQDHTDFTKAIMEIGTHCKERNLTLNHVLVICQAAGRIDQSLGNINTLFLTREKQLLDNQTQVYLMTDDALSWLLEPGDHVIRIPDEVRFYKKTWCSLVPIGEPCLSVTTSGLQWNLSISFNETNFLALNGFSVRLPGPLCGRGKEARVNPGALYSDDSTLVIHSHLSPWPVSGDKSPLRFGGIVSSSNTYSDSDTVNIQCSSPLLWSMKIPSLIRSTV